MKKYLFAALGAGLLMTSCQSDEPFAPGNGTAQQVAFTVSLPDAVSTRAGGTNSAAGGVSNNVGADVTFNVALYLGENLVYAHKQTVSSTGNHTSATFEPTLVIGEQYRVVAFAEFDDDVTATGKGDNPQTNIKDLIAIESGINNEKNDEYFVSTTLTAAPELSATLKRPYGKLRLVAEDLHEAERQFGSTIANVEVTYKYTRPTTFNVIAGTFNPAYTEAAQTFTAQYGVYGADTDNARTIFVDYIPGKYDGSESMMPFTVTVNFANGKTYTRDFRQDIPVKRNHLTTLKGRLFTIDSDLKLTIEEGFEGETEKNFANDLEWVAANGGTVNLTQDITLTEALNVTKDMVINLNGNTVTGNINVAEGVSLTVDGGAIVNTNKEVSGITSNGDLTLNDVEITSARHAIRIESGKAVINGGKYMVDPISKSTLHALNVGDNGTTAEVIIKGGTFIGPKGTMADSGGAVTVKVGSTVTIEGGDFSGGKTKTLSNGGTLTISGGSFDQDPTAFVANGYKAIEKDGKYYVVANTVDAVATTKADIENALSSGDANVYVVAGEYTMPAGGKFSAGDVITCAEGVVFTGNSKLNINGATVIGAKFSNSGGTAVDQTINGTFKGCTFEGSNALRYCYAGETCVFENCDFSGSLYGVHFDGGENKEITFKNCKLSGFNAFAAKIKMVTFEGCTFVGNGKSGYNGANLWGSAKMINCEFTFDGTTSNEWIDCIGADKTYEFVNCTVNGVAYTPSNYTEYLNVIESRNDVTVKINGVDCAM